MGLSRVGIWLCVALCAWLAATTPVAAAGPAAAADDWGLPQLMQELAQVKSASAQFTERKTMHTLSAPLVASGTLGYVAPDLIQKVTLAPVPERFVLDGDKIVMTGGPDGQVHKFSLTDYPQIGGLVEGIRATLAGDLPTLGRFYTVQLTGSAADWQLLLQSKDADLVRFVKWIRIQGSGNRIEAIATENSDGDHSEMSIVEDVSNAR
ncbi:MAG: LolA-related protein [Stellaceae bacterium]